ncbi:MAG: chalcone isomerase family protein [Bacteroidia bacterium]|nr:chalcone isomerase family protein [Bacteroidia bacterium]
MKKLISFLALVVILVGISPLNAQTTQYFGVPVPNSLDANGTKLVLNGAGLREKLWIDLYVGSLFLQSKSTNRTQIINDDKPMAIRLQIVSGLITSDKMIAATKEGFEKSTKGNMAPIQSQIDQFIGIFKKSPIVKGNNYNIIYTPGTGVQVYLNDKIQDTIKGLEFKKALFGIWFCDDPADEDLMEGMLGE